MRTDQIVLTEQEGQRPFLIGNGHFRALVGFEPDEDVLSLRHVGFLDDQASFAEPEACRLVIRQQTGEILARERSLNLRDGIAACALGYQTPERVGMQMRSAYCMEDPKILCVHLSDMDGMELEIAVEGLKLTKTSAAFDRIFFEGEAGSAPVHLLGILFAVSDGPIRTDGARLRVQGNECMLFLAMETDYVMDPREEAGKRWREILKKCVDTEIEKAVHGYLGGKARDMQAFTEPVRIDGQDEVARRVMLGACLIRQLFSSKSPLPPYFWDTQARGQGQRTLAVCRTVFSLNQSERLMPIHEFLFRRLMVEGSQNAREQYALPGRVNAYGQAIEQMEDPEKGLFWAELLLLNAWVHPESLRLIKPLALFAASRLSPQGQADEQELPWILLLKDFLHVCRWTGTDSEIAPPLLQKLTETELPEECKTADGETPELTGQMDDIFAAIADTQSVLDRIFRPLPCGLELLPGLPDAWRTGTAQGLRAGPLTIQELSWREMMPVRLVLEGTGGKTVLLRYGNRTLERQMPPDGQMKMDEDELKARLWPC